MEWPWVYCGINILIPNFDRYIIPPYQWQTPQLWHINWYTVSLHSQWLLLLTLNPLTPHLSFLFWFPWHSMLNLTRFILTLLFHSPCQMATPTSSHVFYSKLATSITYIIIITVDLMHTLVSPSRFGAPSQATGHNSDLTSCTHSFINYGAVHKLLHMPYNGQWTLQDCKMYKQSNWYWWTTGNCFTQSPHVCSPSNLTHHSIQFILLSTESAPALTFISTYTGYNYTFRPLYMCFIYIYLLTRCRRDFSKDHVI